MDDPVEGASDIYVVVLAVKIPLNHTNRGRYAGALGFQGSSQNGKLFFRFSRVKKKTTKRRF